MIQKKNTAYKYYQEIKGSFQLFQEAHSFKKTVFATTEVSRKQDYTQI